MRLRRFVQGLERGIRTCLDVNRSVGTLAYEEFRGPKEIVGPEEPLTCVIVHGLLGQAKNFRTFSSKMATEAARKTARPWRIFALDLRCHGNSTTVPGLAPPHTIEASARDIMHFVDTKVGARSPDVLCGHSLGGKIVLSYCEQVAAEKKALPRHTWILDAQPGKISRTAFHDVRRVLEAVKKVPVPIATREELYSLLKPQGFSQDLMLWMGSSLVPVPGDAARGLTWTFDPDGADAMYSSYQDTCYWHVLQRPPAGTLHVLRAERSDRWTPEMMRRLDAAVEESQGASGRTVAHVLEKAGHWVHADQPGKLRTMMLPSFEDSARQ